MDNFICCNDIMELKLNLKDNEIKTKCNICNKELNYKENHIKLCRILEDYLKIIKKNITKIENINVGETIKLIGKNKNKNNIVATTEVTSWNKEQISIDLALIKNIKNKNIISGDDVPSLNLPFEEEGLVCEEIKIEILKINN